MKFYSDDRVDLYGGDSLAVLASLPTGEIGGVVSDRWWIKSPDESDQEWANRIEAHNPSEREESWAVASRAREQKRREESAQ